MPRPEESSTRLPTLRDAERAHIIRVLEATEWNKLEAAKVLDISRGTLYRKIEEFGLERVREPHVKHLRGQFWEMRMKGKDSISRAIYVTASGQRAEK